jgi:dihydrofolate reductase
VLAMKGGTTDDEGGSLEVAGVEELSISIAPVVLGDGKRLFDGFHQSLSLEHQRLVQSPLATHITYRVAR